MSELVNTEKYNCLTGYPDMTTVLGVGNFGLGFVGPCMWQSEQRHNPVIFLNRNSDSWKGIEHVQYYDVVLNDIESKEIVDRYRIKVYHPHMDFKEFIEECMQENVPGLVITDEDSLKKVIYSHTTTFCTALGKGLEPVVKELIHSEHVRPDARIYCFENDHVTVKNLERLAAVSGKKKIVRLVVDRVVPEMKKNNDIGVIQLSVARTGSVVILKDDMSQIICQKKKDSDRIKVVVAENEEQFQYYADLKFNTINFGHVTVAIIAYNEYYRQHGNPLQCMSCSMENFLDPECISIYRTLSLAYILPGILTLSKEDLTRIYDLDISDSIEKAYRKAFLDVRYRNDLVINCIRTTPDKVKRALDISDVKKMTPKVEKFVYHMMDVFKMLSTDEMKTRTQEVLSMAHVDDFNLEEALMKGNELLNKLLEVVIFLYSKSSNF